ncbi:MAG TPA: hypothetical protein VKP11_12435 [Frankiaceae bacterium]|nr:hypothetical protein [Frankiaceae bacterium]
MSPRAWQVIAAAADVATAAALLAATWAVAAAGDRTRRDTRRLWIGAGLLAATVVPGYVLPAVLLPEASWQACWSVLVAVGACWFVARRRAWLRSLSRSPRREVREVERRRRTLETYDDVVQSLALASYALDLGDPVRARTAIDDGLARARTALRDLLDDHGPGELVRAAPSLGDRPRRRPERGTP